jgi:hypothetical protein
MIFIVNDGRTFGVTLKLEWMMPLFLGWVKWWDI